MHRDSMRVKTFMHQTPQHSNPLDQTEHYATGIASGITRMDLAAPNVAQMDFAKRSKTSRQIT